MTLVNTVEAFFDETATDTPRLLRVIFVTAFACALKNLTVREMIEMLTLGIGTDPESAAFMAESLLSPFNLENGRQAQCGRPPVGSEEVITRSRSLSQSQSRQQSRSRGTQIAEHESTGEAIAEGTTHGISDTRSFSEIKLQ
jgi:hypothetical protein